jgi:hypothetical protein
MEHRISNLKTEFNDISLIRDKINNIFESLKVKMNKLKLLYSDFIKNSKSQLFVFGLDSFHFQSKLIDLEYDDMIRMFLAINNRMYCEYFKLYKIIISYISENISDKKILDIIKGNNFPVYKDLEPFKDYKFEIIIEVHENILILLNSIMSIVNHRENELSLHKNKQLIGLNIDNFVNSFNFEIVIMKEKINLFLSYIEFFHKMHSKYLQRFNNRILLMYNNINSDIHFDDNNVSQDKKNEDINNNNNKNSLDSKNIELKIEVNNDEHEYEFNNNESGLTTPSNMSYKSNQNEVIKKQKSSLQSMFKNGLKKVNNIISGCNNVKVIENDYNNSFINSKITCENELLTMEEIYNEISSKSEKDNYYDMSLTLLSSECDNNVTNETEHLEELYVVQEIAHLGEVETLDEVSVNETAPVEEVSIVQETALVEEVIGNELVTMVEVNTPKIDNVQKKRKKKKNK